MSQYDNTDTFVLFKNKDKQSENQPDYTGKVNMGGTEKRLAAWITKSNAGETFMRGKVSDFREGQGGNDQQQSQPAGGDPDSDIPFASLDWRVN